jgi:hypothetical protein
MYIVKRIRKALLLSSLGPSLLALSACGTSAPTSSNGTVSFGVQGTRPDSLTVMSEQALGVLSRLSGAERSPLVDATAEPVEIEVIGTDGSVIGTLTVTDARIVLKRIKFKTLEEREQEDESEDVSSVRSVLSGSEDGEDAGEDIEACGDSEDASETEDNVVFRGPFVVNLLTNESTPSFSELDVPAGDYREIEMRMHKVRGCERDDQGAVAVAETDPLYNQSVVIQGSYTASGGAARDFAYIDDEGEEFQLSGASASVGFTVAEGVSQNILVAFRMARWFDFTGLDVSLADASGSGPIQLDVSASDADSQIRELIRENLKASADYGKDEDKDGKLEKDEDDDSDEDSSEDEQDD